MSVKIEQVIKEDTTKMGDKTKRDFLISGQSRSKTQEEISRENKFAKDAKKNVNNIIKTNKDAIEEMTKNATKASERLENKLAKMGQDIADSNKEVQNSILTLAEALKNILVPKVNPPQPIARQETPVLPTPALQPPICQSNM